MPIRYVLMITTEHSFSAIAIIMGLFDSEMSCYNILYNRFNLCVL